MHWKALESYFTRSHSNNTLGLVITIIKWDLFFHAPYSPDSLFQLYILIAIPLLFAGITFTLKILNKALTGQSLSFMIMMADSKKKEDKS